MGLKYSDHLVTQTNLQGWYRFKTAVSGNHVMQDDSGNGRTLTCLEDNAPILTAYNNGHYGWYFNGSRTPLKWTGAITPKHVFVVAAAEDATFNLNRGLLSGIGTLGGDVLVSDSSGSDFFDLTATTADYLYRKNNVLLAAASQAAPMSMTAAVIEVQTATGIGLDGIQIGQQRDIEGRLWKGMFLEAMIYDRVLSEAERARIYKYFANMYHIWEDQALAGPDIFPFTQNWGSADPRRKRVLGDTAEDSSTMVYRTKRGMKRSPDLTFDKRLPDEMEAAEAFYDEHHPGTEFVFRDKTVSPASELDVRFPIDAEMDVVPQGPSNFMYKFPLEEV